MAIDLHKKPHPKCASGFTFDCLSDESPFPAESSLDHWEPLSGRDVGAEGQEERVGGPRGAVPGCQLPPGTPSSPRVRRFRNACAKQRAELAVKNQSLQAGKVINNRQGLGGNHSLAAVPSLQAITPWQIWGKTDGEPTQSAKECPLRGAGLLLPRPAEVGPQRPKGTPLGASVPQMTASPLP